MRHLTALLLPCLSVIGLYPAGASICEKLICEYEFEIRWARTMTYTVSRGKVYNVALNGTKLNTIRSQSKNPWDENLGLEVDPEDVITGDGRQRNILVINKQFPGPAIEVYEGSQVVVHVTNELHTTGISIHWHGMRLQNNAWMDGTPYITQCPILPGQSFTYRFKAEPPGTHMYYPHFGGLRANGAYGMLVVHAGRPQAPYSLVTLSDWFIQEADTMTILSKYNREAEDRGAADHVIYAWGRDYTVAGHEVNSILFQSALINGRGSWDGDPYPLEKFTVNSNVHSRHRFRIASQASEFTFEVSIDSHILHVMAISGHEIKPISVDSVVINAGETIDFEIDTTANGHGSYWFRANLLREGTTTRHLGGNTTRLWEDAIERLHQDVLSKEQLPVPVTDDNVKGVKAIVQYDNMADANEVPTTEPKACTSSNMCTLFNCPYEQYSKYHNKICISMASAVSVNSQEYMNKMYGLDDKDYTEIFLNVGYNWGSSFNARRFVESKFPVYASNFEAGIVKCSEAGCEDDPSTGCVCTHMLHLPYNTTVQLVISNYELENPGYFPLMGSHSIHLHGQDFTVLAIGYAIQDDETGLWKAPNPDVYCENKMCKEPRWTSGSPELNTQNPPVVDTVTVPAKGYIVIRFRTTNPGPWLLHCHHQSHFEEGMSILLQSGEDHYPALPINFPTCHNFSWSSQEYDTYVEEKGVLSNNVPHNNGGNCNGDGNGGDDIYDDDGDEPRHTTGGGDNGDGGHKQQNEEGDEDLSATLKKVFSDGDHAVKLTRGELIILILCSFGAGMLIVSICCCFCFCCLKKKKGKKENIRKNNV